MDKKELRKGKQWNNRIYLLCQVILICLVAVIIGYPKDTHAENTISKISVNFAQSIQTPSMSGFLNSIEPPVPSALITPLKPFVWRLSPDDLPTYLKSNASAKYIQVILSDGYGYPLNNWNGRGKPWENGGKTWESYVREVARQYRNVPNIQWDVWNEPDSSEWVNKLFWDGTQKQFYETYQRAYRVLREELGPNAVIAGPSYANFQPQLLKEFLAFCNQNGLEVNVLTWHELDAADQNIPAIPSHVAQIKTLLASYPNVKTRQIVINETVGQSAEKQTGDILAYLYYLEQSGIGGAVKACWNAKDGTNNCYNGSLDGLIDPKARQPRSAWWVYKLYADGVNSRIRNQELSPGIITLASRQPLQLLISDNRGRYQKTPIQLQLSQLNNVIPSSVKTLKATLSKLPNTQEAVLRNPSQVSKHTLTIQNGSATLQLPVLTPHTTYWLTLQY